jgi:glycosyltransferase involved in cell wall biosynthesis
VVSPGDGEALAAGIERLLCDDDLRMKLGENAVADSRARFDLQRQTDEYLEWYGQLIRNRHSMTGQGTTLSTAGRAAI